MELVVKLASLGHSARNQAAIKVRQPLSEAAFAVGSAPGVRVLEQYADLLADELNVKQVRGLGSAGEAVFTALTHCPGSSAKNKARMPAIRYRTRRWIPSRSPGHSWTAGLSR